MAKQDKQDTRARMEISMVDIGKIRMYGKNPRRNDSAVDAVAESIRNFGFKVPIVIDSGNTIICGHTRYKAARKLGMKQVPCIMADDLTPEQVRAFRLVDNKVSELAQWDFEILEAEMDDMDFDFSAFGFSVPEFPDTGFQGGGNPPTPAEAAQPAAQGALPPELAGVDISPEALPKINEEGDTQYERVIIVYRKGESERVAAMLGLQKIDKVVYNLEELDGLR